jgi:protease I
MLNKKNLIILFLIFILLLTGCGIENRTQNIRGENMTKAIMIIAPKNFQDYEFSDTKKVLEDNGITVEVASKNVTEAKGVFGRKAKIDKDISKINVSEYDVIIFIGGGGASVYLNDSTAFKIAKQAYEQEKILAAICMAPSILANAGLLEGKKATAFPTEQENLEEHGCEYTNEEVTVDGRIITANGPEAAKEFGKTIVNALK